MTTETLTLTDFLLARIAEDEAALNFDGDAEPWLLYRVGHTERCDYPGDQPGYCTCGATNRALAECEAKRRIVEACTNRFISDVDATYTFGLLDPAMEPVVRLLALPYSNHPDYREEWRP